MLGLSEQNRFAMAFQTHIMKTEAGRKRKIETFVAMLMNGQTIYPQTQKLDPNAGGRVASAVRCDRIGSTTPGPKMR